MDYSITFTKVSHDYQLGAHKKVAALKDINLNIIKGSITAIIGHTGSGKSTLVQHINGLLKPTEGSIMVDGHEITPDIREKNLLPIRKQVGMVFQFPEKQLFAETVMEDIQFGPRNFFNDEKMVQSLSQQAFNDVGLPDSVAKSSPFDLSGGQQRRVAIAGVIACRPDILILDEPTVGLDDQGRQKLMQLIVSLHQKRHMTIIIITHQMEVVANYADRVVVMSNGKVIANDTPRNFFSNTELVQKAGVDLPDTLKFASRLSQLGMKFKDLPITNNELVTLIKHRWDEQNE